MKPNPFPVTAWFDRSVTLTFALPADEVRRRIPDCLEPDTFDRRLGFVAVAVVTTRRLRPKGFPAVLGHDFTLVGYRFFVRYRAADGRNLRGLWILRSETDKWRMQILGNLFTSYRYVTTRPTVTSDGGSLSVSDPAGLDIGVTLGGTDPSLPPGSPFADWREARKFCGPMPFTFSYDVRRRKVAIIEGMRSNWKPRPAEVVRATVPYLDSLGLRDLTLANAFEVRDIPYEWKAGRLEPWPR